MENFNTYSLYDFTDDTEKQRQDIASFVGCDIAEVKL